MKNTTTAERVTDPGKGNRTPSLWGRWLTTLGGLQRQMLDVFGIRESRGIPTYNGSAREGDREGVVLKRRAANKRARRQRVAQGMARRGKR